MRLYVRSSCVAAVVLLAAPALRAQEAAKPAEPAAAPAAEKPAEPAAEKPAEKKARPNSAAIMDTAARGGTESLAALVTQTLTSYAANTLGMDVIAKDDVARLISFEMQRQLLGCEADSCGQATEIGSALGVEKLVTSTLGKIGERFQLSVVVMDVATAKVAGRATREVRSEDEIVENARDLVHFALKGEERESKGYLRVTVGMTNARIVVDGVEAGRSPMAPLRILGGKHRVLVEREGYIPMEASIEVTPGKETLVDAKLLPKKDIKVAGSGFLPFAWTTAALAGAGAVTSGVAYWYANDIYHKQYKQDVDGAVQSEGCPADARDCITQSDLKVARDKVDLWGNKIHFYSAIGSGVLAGVSAVLFSAYFLSGLGAGGDEPPDAVTVEPTPGGVLVRF